MGWPYVSPLMCKRVGKQGLSCSPSCERIVGGREEERKRGREREGGRVRGCKVGFILE